MRVGVTGHRSLQGDHALTAQIDRALDRIQEMAPHAPSTLTRLTVVSPLAEGADRLVACRVLERTGAELEVPLPLPKKEYLDDFKTSESKAQFEKLLKRAVYVGELPLCDSRDEAYEEVGRHVVERSDILIALWDGLPPRGIGGTSRIVSFARERGIPVLWINSQSPYSLTEYLGNGLKNDGLEELDEYNHLSIDEARADRRIKLETEPLKRTAGGSGVELKTLAPLCAWNLPFLVRADVLAERCKRRFFWMGDGVAYLAALATVIAAVVAILAANHPRLVLLEVAVLILILLLLYASKRARWHERWIYYRFLAEHFRSQLYLALAGIREEAVFRQETGHEWLDRATEQVWRDRPRFDAPEPVPALKVFLAREWIGGQVSYQEKTCRRLEGLQRRLSYATYSLFGVTLLAALAHGIGLGTGIDHFSETVIFLAIALPAVAGAIQGVGTQREFERHAVRAKEMCRRLSSLQRLMNEASDISHVKRVARAAAALMLSENRDWFVVMEFRDIELHV